MSKLNTYKLLSDLPIFPTDVKSVVGNYEVQVQAKDVSDGHHTMEELYEHRHRLFIALMKIYDNYITPLGCEIVCWKSRKHDDGSEFPGWFIAGMTATKSAFDFSTESKKFDISYHLPDKYWHLVNVITFEKAPPYDGYTSADVLERLLRL